MNRHGLAIAALALAAAPAFAQGGEAPEGTPGTIPPPPPGCASTTASFANNTPVPIPTGPAVVSSTIVVAGAGTFLWDVNVLTAIAHTNNSDLDVTVQSPSGTVVTLTTDNGGSNDNVYNGTLWNDSANPGGQVPYASNNGLVNDHTYANLVLASPLAPEDSLAAFLGENPNGTWTLTISDDLASASSGSLASWSVEITTIPSAPVTANTVVANNTPVVIPPTAPPNVVTSTVVVAGAGTFLYDLDLTTTLTHTFAGDLDITLMSPAGTIVTVTSDNGGGNDNVFNGTVWDDDADPDGQVPYTTNANLATDHPYVNLVLASPLVPEEAFAAFIGENPNGTWTLTISDDANQDGGTLASWSLDIDTATCPVQACTLTCPANVTQSNDTNFCGAVVNYPAPTTSGQCGQINCLPAAGAFFPVGTTTVTCTEEIPAGPTGGATCGFTITVNDTQPPSITPPADVNVGTDAPLCSATVNYPPPTVSDNCPGVAAPTCAPPSGSSFVLGTTPVACQVADAAGNTAGAGFDVTVFDDDPPALVCPADIFTTAPPGALSTIVDYVEPVPTDNCPNPTAGCAPPPGDAFPVGTTIVTCTATDGAGLTTNCDFDVVVSELAIQEIPTASAAGLAGLALLLAAAGFVALRRRG